LEVEEVAPFGMVTVVTEGGDEVSLPDEVASAVSVRLRVETTG
jgi:DtxR family Mn-dependent transcriptional regulator